MSDKLYTLKGSYNLKDFQKILNMLYKLPEGCLVDYNKAKLDMGIQILIDDFNSKVSGQNILKASTPKKNELDDLNQKEILQELLSKDKLTRKNKKQWWRIEFFIYILGFFKEIFSYVVQVWKFSKILFQKPQQQFQKEILLQDVLNNIYTMGLQAIPIILFLGFAWGVITALQGAIQLKPFGAEFFALDLAIVIFFKEMGWLLSMIILAARAGSSTIAKLGSMRISDEWNVMRVLGIDPELFLLKPKIIAFIVLMPILSYITCLAGIFGAFIVLQGRLNIGAAFLISVLNRTLDIYFFSVMMWKGPIFGLIIGLICTHAVTTVKIHSDSMVVAITRGVVYSICGCIIFDMLFNIISAKLG